MSSNQSHQKQKNNEWSPHLILYFSSTMGFQAGHSRIHGKYQTKLPELAVTVERVGGSVSSFTYMFWGPSRTNGSSWQTAPPSVQTRPGPVVYLIPGSQVCDTPHHHHDQEGCIIKHPNPSLPLLLGSGSTGCPMSHSSEATQHLFNLPVQDPQRYPAPNQTQGGPAGMAPQSGSQPSYIDPSTPSLTCPQPSPP